MFFIRSFEAMYQYINEAIATLTTYIDEQIASVPTGMKFVDRGDPAVADFDKNALTESGAWIELDLSGIIPKEARLVKLRLVAQSELLTATCSVRKKGNINEVNVDRLEVSATGVPYCVTLCVACGSDGIIEYKFSAIMFWALDITVRGWWE